MCEHIRSLLYYSVQVALGLVLDRSACPEPHNRYLPRGFNCGPRPHRGSRGVFRNCIKYSWTHAKFLQASKLVKCNSGNSGNINASEVFRDYIRGCRWAFLTYCRCTDVICLGSCCCSAVWQGPTNMWRTAIFVTMQAGSIAACKSSDVAKLFWFLLSSYGLIGSWNNVRNCIFHDCTGTFLQLTSRVDSL
jgi:hypothetical protein